VRCDGNARERHSNVDRSTRWNEGRKERRARACAERTRRRTKTARRARRARPGFGRAAAPIDRTIDRSIIVIESVHLQRVRVRARSVSRANDKIVLVGRSYAPMLSDINSASVLVSRSRLSSAACAFSVLRMENTDHAKAVIYTRRHHHRQSLSRPHTRPRMDTSSRIIRPIARVSPVLAPSRPIRIHPFLRSPSRARRLHARVFATPPPSHRIASHRPSLARTKHIKNTLGPYSQSDSPGGASTLYTIPSRMNITRAQENMNHTVTCRPTNVLFSSSSLVTIASSLRSPRAALVDDCRRQPSRPVPPSRRLAVVDRPSGPDPDPDPTRPSRSVGRSRSDTLSLLLVYCMFEYGVYVRDEYSLCDVMRAGLPGDVSVAPLSLSHDRSMRTGRPRGRAARRRDAGGGDEWVD